MTYQEYFKEKKEETLRLLNFYGDTQKLIKEFTTVIIADSLTFTDIKLKDAKKSMEVQEGNLFGSLVKISPAMLSYYSLYLNQPLLVLGFSIMFYGVQEMEHYGLIRQTPFSWKNNKRAVKQVHILEKKKERLEKREESAKKILVILDGITSRLAKELVFWDALEELAQGRVEVISEDTIEIGNQMSETLRGDLMIELFGTIDAPVEVPTLTMKFVD